MSYLSMAMVFCVDDLPVETPQKGLQRNFSHLERWISQRCSIHRIWGKIQLVSMLHLHNFAYILSYVIHVCHILPYFVMFCKEHVIYQLKKKTDQCRPLIYILQLRLLSFKKIIGKKHVRQNGILEKYLDPCHPCMVYLPTFG